jgi:hypothetical protein
MEESVKQQRIEEGVPAWCHKLFQRICRSRRLKNS